MTRSADIIVYNWLREMKISASKTYIRQQLLSHPDYPSLLSITDTLDELGIENAALVVDKERLNEIPVPFLAHTAAKGGEFILITDLKKLFKKHTDFEKQWNGVIVATEKPEQWNNAENEKWLAKEKRQKRFLWLTIASIIFISALSLWNQFSWQYLGLFITSLAGFGVAVLIVQHELGISNEFTEQLCAAGKNTDCDAVMQSKGSKFLSWFNWADAGIIYFSSVFLLLTISFFVGTVQPLTTILSLLATFSLPLTFFSVYYQWRIVKKWCPLCLATVVLLWAQFFILLPQLLSLTQSFGNISFNDVLLSSFLLFITATAWLWLKPLLKENKKLETENFAGKRFKYNADVFMAVLEKQRKIDTIPFKNDLQLGDPTARLQIIVACNPYCGPCAQAHELLHELVGSNDIGLTVRFTINTENKEDKKLQAATYIYHLANGKEPGYKRMVLHDWNKLMNMEKFIEKYPDKKIEANYGDNGISGFVNDSFVYEVLLQQEKWSNESKITKTPTIFINGNEKPKQYNVNDLVGLIRAVAENYKNEIDAVGQTKLQPQDLSLNLNSEVKFFVQSHSEVTVAQLLLMDVTAYYSSVSTLASG